MEKMLTTEEVAEATRVTAHTVRYWRNRGCGPRGFRLGRRVLYREADVESWIAQRQAGGSRGAS